MEIRVTVPGHTQRGGSPCPYDRVLSTRIRLRRQPSAIMDEEYGYMIGMVNGQDQEVCRSAECAGKLKYGQIRRVRSAGRWLPDGRESSFGD